MKLKGNTVLITGGASGIGLALAERFLKNGSKVIICGRSEVRLKEAREKNPKLHIKQCDVSVEEQRLSLFEEITKEFPDINILINNAGMQQQLDLKEVEWNTCKKEIATNYEAPIHLTTLFVPFFANKKDAFIVNVTSGLAFLPSIFVPIYASTKSGMHTFTFCLRQQVADLNIGVLEVIPPPVKTGLGGEGVHASVGADLDEYADSVMAGFAAGELELTFGFSTANKDKSRKELELMAERMWSNRGTPNSPL